MRLIVVSLIFFLLSSFGAYAQQDTTNISGGDTMLIRDQQNGKLPFLDSVALAMQQRQQFISDSLATQYIAPGDSTRHNQLIDTLLKKYLYTGQDFLDIPMARNGLLQEGKARETRDPWTIVIILGLIIYTAILHRIMGKDFESIWQSFYSKRMLNQVSKDDGGFISSWTFIALFLLFGFTFGLFLYQLAAYYHVYYSISGFQLFVSLSFIILVLFAVKFLIVKFLGFVFDINRLVSEYLSVLFLTYFNIAFVFLPVTLCFSLLASQYIPYVLLIALVLVVAIFIWQYLRSSVNIISNILFHKFYLIVYLCALEICPVLILIKALKI
ncbi:MAG TPA: DUF4271 domain-containing protein [Mucilaginibacter sp.]|nr:DUF4271 domain-containing protein [Mucilaginibacter sp.]